jgi:endonuclease YncB( thermonuclease family)
VILLADEVIYLQRELDSVKSTAQRAERNSRGGGGGVMLKNRRLMGPAALATPESDMPATLGRRRVRTVVHHADRNHQPMDGYVESLTDWKPGNTMRLITLMLACTLPVCVQAQDGSTDVKPVPPARQSTVSGRAAAIDGDTIVVGLSRIRLWGIDAPEMRQTCPSNGIMIFGNRWPAGQASQEFLKGLLLSPEPPLNRVISCKIIAVDPYQRSLARCTMGGIDIAAMMVEAGMAWAYRQYTNEYASAENTARSFKRGVWAHPCLAQWDWRRVQEQRDPALRPPL